MRVVYHTQCGCALALGTSCLSILRKRCGKQCLHSGACLESRGQELYLQVSLDDHAFNKQQTLKYVKGYAHEAPEMTVQDPRVPSGLTDLYKSGGYNPASYTGSPTYSNAKKEETLPDWVVNNNKVSNPKQPSSQRILESTPAVPSYFCTQESETCRHACVHIAWLPSITTPMHMAGVQGCQCSGWCPAKQSKLPSKLLEHVFFRHIRRVRSLLSSSPFVRQFCYLTGCVQCCLRYVQSRCPTG